MTLIIATTASYLSGAAGLEERVDRIPHKTKITFNWMEILMKTQEYL